MIVSGDIDLQRNLSQVGRQLGADAFLDEVRFRKNGRLLGLTRVKIKGPFTSHLPRDIASDQRVPLLAELDQFWIRLSRPALHIDQKCRFGQPAIFVEMFQRIHRPPILVAEQPQHRRAEHLFEGEVNRAYRACVNLIEERKRNGAPV